MANAAPREHAAVCVARWVTVTHTRHLAEHSSAARKFLCQLASAGNERTAEAFLIHALISISAQLQRGNALVLQRSMQHLPVEQSVLPMGIYLSLFSFSRRRQQCLFDERAALKLDISALHASMRVMCVPAGMLALSSPLLGPAAWSLLLCTRCLAFVANSCTTHHICDSISARNRSSARAGCPVAGVVDQTLRDGCALSTSVTTTAQ